MKNDDMHKEYLQQLFDELWDIMDTAENTMRVTPRDDSDEKDVPDFSAVVQAVLAEKAQGRPAESGAGFTANNAGAVAGGSSGSTGKPSSLAAGSGSVMPRDDGTQPPAPKKAPVVHLKPLPDYAESCRTLEEIAWRVNECTRCGLCEKRIHAVPGNGVMKPKVMIIGEAPGAEEDKCGEPFVGRAGKYLDSWMGAIKLFRGRDLFIGNVIKCRPPGNRDPYPDEQKTCIPFLKKQIRILRPKTILCVGRIAAQILTGKPQGIGKLRKAQYTEGIYRYEGIPMIFTYHPSAVLRNPQDYRAPVWEDLQLLRKLLLEAEKPAPLSGKPGTGVNVGS